MAERLLLEAMAAVDGSLTRWWAECDRLRERAAFSATGVVGACSNVLPANGLREATASVYAEIAHRLGWLELDRALSAGEFRRLSAVAVEYPDGRHARHAAGVFDNQDAGLAWAARHQVTGILAEYPHGGAYDVAVSEGRFTPSKAHHGTADHVAAFSPGLRHIHLIEGRPDE
jgi:hypothetical protein